MTQRTIWKTILRVAAVQEIMIPMGSEMLCAKEQFNKICVWYRCDPSAPKEPRTIAIIGTGYAAPADGHYLGSASLEGGSFIFHVFSWPN